MTPWKPYLAFALLVLSAAPALSDPSGWAVAAGPAGGGSDRAIGRPVAGCLAGGLPLPPEGEGFEMLRRWRNRYWGTAELVDYLETLGRKAAAAGLPPFLIGDMAQPRGGPLPYGHASHETGIDVDIFFQPGPMPAAARETVKDLPSMLTADRAGVDAGRFGTAQTALLRLAAQDPRSVRIFVNPRLKIALCGRLPAGDRAWLHKLRPWFGHDDHFHVRLACPPGSPECREQDPVPPGEGCDETLRSWVEPPPPGPRPAPKPARKPAMPASCLTILNAP